MTAVDINKMTKAELLAYAASQDAKIAQLSRRAIYAQLFDNSECTTENAPAFNGKILFPGDFVPGWYDVALFYPDTDKTWVFKLQLKQMTQEFADKAQAKLDAYRAKREEGNA